MRYLACFAALTVVLVPAAAGAQPIVLESYVGARPSDADQLIKPMLKILEGRSYLVGREVSKRIETRHSMPALIASASELEEAKRFVRSGRKQYILGAFGTAISELGRGRAVLANKPATMVGNQSARDTYFEALAYLSLTYHKLNRSDEAREAMAELIRSFPNRPVGRGRYGPVGQALYKKTRANLRAQGSSSMEVDLDTSTAVVFVNEKFRGTGNTRLAPLNPGVYRLFTKVGERTGRVHTVTANGGTRASKNISFAVDSTLKSQRFAGMVFRDAAERKAHEARNAIAVARTVGATAVVVVFVGEVNGQRAVYGAYYSLDSTKVVRQAAIAADSANPSSIGTLARHLAGESDKVPGNILPPEGGAGGGGGSGNHTGGSDRMRDPKRPYKTWKWVALVTGTAAIAAGVTLIAVHVPEVDSNGERNLDARNTRTTGIITAGVGTALVIGGVLLWRKDNAHKRRKQVSVVPTRGGAMFTLGGRF